MRRLIMLGVGAATIGATALAANAQTFAISLGIRETNTAAPIGGDGGTANGIEFVNLDGQTLTLDGTWQTFTFNFGTDSVTIVLMGRARVVILQIIPHSSSFLPGEIPCAS